MRSEFSSLSPDSSTNIYKLVGPILLKQSPVDAKTAVDGRIGYIEKEISRIEGQIEGVQGKMEGMRGEIYGLQSQLEGSEGGTG